MKIFPLRRDVLVAAAAASLLLLAGYATAADAAPGSGSLVPKPSAPDLKPFTLEDRYFDAARRGDLAMLQVCIEKGIQPSIKDELGRSALALAVRDARNLEMAEFLHARGVAMDDADAVGRSPLHEAAGHGDTRITVWLLENGADVSRKDMQGRTPLHNAVMGGSRAVAVLLLDAKADANARDNFQDTPLIAACSKGLDEIARLLVERGADASLKDQEGRTAGERAEETAPYCRSLAGPKPATP
ncbi:MAG: ankyrin repeat domain-containing protein [Candidatus Binatia bacterium]